MMRRVIGKSRPAGPRTTFLSALCAETLRLQHSPLVPLHLVCALAAGGLCGAYFAYAPWDASMGVDASVQLLGAAMPLMAGIVCGLDADAEDEATGQAALLSVPSRRTALAARVAVLWLMGFAALLLAAAALAAPLMLAGRDALGPGAYGSAAIGLAFGSVPLYLILYAVALRWGRNVAIAVGGVGLMLAFFSVGGLAHGLMTGTLTAASANAFSHVPTSWAVLLGSQAVELAIASGSAGSADVAASIALALRSTLGLCTAAAAMLSCFSAAWIVRFEPARRGE